MRSRTCIGSLLLPLAIAACGTADTEPLYRMEISYGGPTQQPPAPATAQLTPDPATGALNPSDIENAVRTHVAAHFAASAPTAQVLYVQCLTGGPPLIYPATTLCHTGVGLPDTDTNMSLLKPSYLVTLTNGTAPTSVDSWGGEIQAACAA